MGQQQFLLLLLGLLVVAVAIGIGASQFSAQDSQGNKDGVTTTLVAIAANAYQYRMLPSTLGGGGRSYSGYTISPKMRNDDYGTYSASSANASSLVLTGTSGLNSAFVATCTVDDTGRTWIAYTGW